ncbi:hypothetical protein TRIUR3_03908 [Triticum urartu]|uniref:Uncharacterized protein n=1 Tax=Triticum urartu TaxID=4572 RepID=M7Z8G8_TRIUA|nr:hypothetical protein TRIUR3_03908 [Triticum urartu]
MPMHASATDHTVYSDHMSLHARRRWLCCYMQPALFAYAGLTVESAQARSEKLICSTLWNIGSSAGPEDTDIFHNFLAPNSTEATSKERDKMLPHTRRYARINVVVCMDAPACQVSIPQETSSAQYILQQYLAASGGHRLLASVRNSYAMGKVRMVATEFENAGRLVKNRNAARCAEPGRFVLWQMAPEKWYIELAVGGSKVHAGCNGKLVWRHTPWLGSHAAKGPVRPLRRALQGLDPLTAASMFAGARCIGERKVNGEDCFILKLCTDPETLKARTEGLAEIIRHVMFGYFSQRTGLLVHIEDSHLTRIQSTTGGDAVYWETTINSFIEDYRPVDGIMIAHSGRSAVTLFRFGEVAMSHTKTRMEEAWSIEEVAFNVPGLSMDCFIPPTDIKSGSVSETVELPHGGEKSKFGPPPGHRAKVAALEKTDGGELAWRGAHT